MPVLFLDAAAPLLAIGLQVSGSTPEWRTTADEAGVGLFQETDVLLRAAAIAVDNIRTVVFCEGPGSLLGIRLAAMALRTWMALPRDKPLRVLAYRSLALVAADLLAQGEASPFHVLNDARRETWNVLTVSGDKTLGEIRRCRADELPRDGRLFCPEGFPHWQPLPADVRPIAYRPQTVLDLATKFPLLREVDAPDAFMTEMPTYRAWNPTTEAQAKT